MGSLCGWVLEIDIVLFGITKWAEGEVVFSREHFQ